nr:hypothetical protein [Serpentinimonas sp.]
MDFPAASEMAVGNPVVVRPDLMSLLSLAPQAASDGCSNAPDAFISFVNPLNGLPSVNLLGTYTDTVAGKEYLVASFKLAQGDQLVTVATGSTGGSGSAVGDRSIFVAGERTNSQNSLGNLDRRIQWREIFNFRTR